MILQLKDGRPLSLPDNTQHAARVIADLFLNSGKTELDDECGKVTWDSAVKNLFVKDAAITSPDIRPMLQSSLEIVIREPVEPMLIVTGLFDRIEAKGMNTQILAGAMGAVTADDVGEEGTYPEVSFQLGGGMSTAYVGKSGIQASFTDEALRYSTWDIMALNFRQMGKALARHKERKAVQFLKTLGTELFNNASPATSLFGVTTGRGLNMAANGSYCQDDLFKAMAHMDEEGFHPDVLLVNPQFFYMGIQDPVLRHMFMMGVGGEYFRPWSGQPGPLDPWSNGSMGARGPSLGNKISRGAASPAGGVATGIAGREHGMTAAPPIPAPYFPWMMRVIVSPFIPFDPETQLGDVMLLSSGNVGYHLVDEDPTTVEWRNEATDVQILKIRERYGFAVAHEGQGVGVMKNIKLARNFWDGLIQAQTTAVSAEIPADVAVV